MRYVITRHAQTDANGRGEFPGLDEPLSETGRSQATALAARLADSSFDSIVHSGSARAAETARVLLNVIKAAQIVEDHRMLEGDVGRWVGMRASMRADAAKESGRPLWEVRPPGGESYLDIDARLQPLLADLRSGAFGSEALFVGHGRVNGLILRALLHTPWLEFNPQQMHHTGVTELEVTADSVGVLSLDDVAHLPAELVTR